MQTYKRNISAKLTLLRVVFFITVGIIIYLFISGNKDYSFVLLFLLAFGSIFPVTGLHLTDYNIVIRQYYVYGLFYRNMIITTADKIEVFPIEVEMNDVGYTGANEWWDIFLIFLPVTKRVTIKKYIIKHTDILDNTNQVKTKLSDKELMMLNMILDKQSGEYQSL